MRLMERDKEGHDVSVNTLNRVRIKGWWTDAFILIALFALLIPWNWHKTPDLLIDFGRELYVAWQLAEGNVLNRDVFPLFGPLSPYVNALLFRLFGVSIRTLLIANLTVIAGICIILNMMIRRIADRVTALLGCAAFLTCFAFAHFVGNGSLNFVSPYAHELTHGIFIALLLILFLNSAVHTRKKWYFAASGFCLGLTVLTKPEVLMATALTVLAGIILLYQKHNRSNLFRNSILFFCAAAVSPAAFFLGFLQVLPPDQALRAVFSAVLPLMETPVAASAFYLHSSGFDYPVLRLITIILSTVLVGLLCWLIAMGGCSVYRRKPHWTGVYATIVTLFICLCVPHMPLILFGLSLPVCSLLILGYAYRRRDASLVLLAVFAAAMLLKIILNARVHHYGFALAMPATILSIIGAVHLLPEILSSRGCHARCIRSIMIGIVIAAICYGVLLSNQYYRIKGFAIDPRPEDTVITYNAARSSVGPIVRDTLSEIDQFLGPHETLTVIPEGIMLNYLSRRRSALPYLNLLPPEYIIYGEQAIIHALRTNPPDAILIVGKSMHEQDVQPFGHDEEYGKKTLQWIGEHYETHRILGADPLSEEIETGPKMPFGMHLLVHRSRNVNK